MDALIDRLVRREELEGNVDFHQAGQLFGVQG